MSKILLTGDTHGDLTLTRLNKVKELNPDYLIITGDFGYIYDGSQSEIKALDEISELPFTILWVDGNHENFNLLKQYPKKMWNGGYIQEIRKNVFRLCRGEIYTIDNKKFFAFGGAKSIDRISRALDYNFWLEECPSIDEKKHGLENLNKHNNKVDYIITHTCAKDTLFQIIAYPEDDLLSDYFQEIKETIDFNKWYFGHLHFDFNVNDKERCLYKNIIELK